MIRDTLYHKLLRVSALLLACVVGFQSSFFLQTSALSRSTTEYMASVVGMSAGVVPNELNLITSELTQQKRTLDERERALSEREIDAQAKDGSDSFRFSDFILSSILLLLVMLIVMNYLFDYLRARSELKTYAKVA